jgi:hypothetical protein
LVLSAVDPAVDDIAEAFLLELLYQTAEPIEKVAWRSIRGVRLRDARRRLRLGGSSLIGSARSAIIKGFATLPPGRAELLSDPKILLAILTSSRKRPQCAPSPKRNATISGSRHQ